MKLLKDLLAGRTIPGIEADQQRRICADTASRLLNTQVTPRQCKFDKGILTLSVSPLIKTELLLRLEEYQALLKAQGLSLTVLR